jgi:hypothetical protein
MHLQRIRRLSGIHGTDIRGAIVIRLMTVLRFLIIREKSIYAKISQFRDRK